MLGMGGGGDMAHVQAYEINVSWHHIQHRQCSPKGLFVMYAFHVQGSNCSDLQVLKVCW